VKSHRRFNSIVSVLEGCESDAPIASWVRFVGRNNEPNGKLWDEEMLKKKRLIANVGASAYLSDETAAPDRFANDLDDVYSYKDQFVDVKTEDVNYHWKTQVQECLFRYIDPNEVSLSMATGGNINGVKDEHVKWTFFSKSNIIKLKFLCYADRRDFANRYLSLGQPFTAGSKKTTSKKKLARLWCRSQKVDSGIKEEHDASMRFDFKPDPSWNHREGTREDPNMQVPWATSYRKLFHGVYWDLTKTAYEIRGCKRGRTLLDPRDSKMFINRLKDQLHQEIPKQQIAHAFMEASQEDPNTKVYVYLYVYDFCIAEGDEFDPSRLENIVNKLATADDTTVNIDIEGREQMKFAVESACIWAPSDDNDIPTLKEQQKKGGLPGMKSVAHPWPYTPEYIAAFREHHDKDKPLPTFKDFKVPSMDSITGGDDFYNYLTKGKEKGEKKKKKKKKKKESLLQIVRFTYDDVRVLASTIGTQHEEDLDGDEEIGANGKVQRTFETQTADFNPETVIEKGISDERKVLLANRLESELESRIWQQDAQFRRDLVNYIYELYKNNTKQTQDDNDMAVESDKIEAVVDQAFTQRLEGMEKCTDCDRPWHFVKPMKTGAFDKSGSWYCSECWQATYGEHWNTKSALRNVQEEKLTEFRARAKTNWMPPK